MSRTPRAWHPEAPEEGSVVVLDREQSHHVVQVLRLREGDSLELFDGGGRGWSAVLVTGSRSGARVRVEREQTAVVESLYPVTLYQALCRPDRMEWVVQKATEIGVRAIHLVRAHRSEGGEPSPDRLERMSRIAREASRQSGRTVVPAIVPPAELPGPPGSGVDAFVLDPDEDATPLADHLGRPSGSEGRLLIGPEGGLEPAEILELERSGWSRASLGPRILRTETAGAVACALLLHAWGDLGGRRGKSTVPAPPVDAPPRPS